MTDQILVGTILSGTLALFLWGRWRHDVVAAVALISAVFLGIVPASEAFMGFGHPAVITVAAVLIVSRALQNSGLIDRLARKASGTLSSPFFGMITLTVMGAVLSGFMNNVGALALLMPLAIQSSPNPARVLMPLSFGTILGGMMTEIGTPPNIIIATYREEAGLDPFGLFDFAPVGAPVAIVGIAFMVLIGWRLLPTQRKGRRGPEELLVRADYLTEVRIVKDGKAIGCTARQFERLVNNEVLVLGWVRHEHIELGRSHNETLVVGDVLILRTDANALARLIDFAGVEMVGDRTDAARQLEVEDAALLEAVVKPGSQLENQSAKTIRLHSRFGINLLALARQGTRMASRLGSTPFKAGDVLLVQGEREFLLENMSNLGGLALAERGLRPARPRRPLIPGVLFAMAIFATAVGLLPVQISFAAAVVGLVLLGSITPRELYDSVDWSVIVLLGALIPVGHALETSGTTQLIAHFTIVMSGEMPLWVSLGALMVVTMALTNLMNNAATAVIMAPIGLSVASQLGASPDPFLMAVAIAASSAFLTPIGHQNNVLVMGPGGYRFGDFWRLGLPLQILVIVVGLPLLLIFWPP